MTEYISREAAIDKMRSLKSSFRAKNDWDSGYDTAIAEAFEHIKRVPVADVQPVKHGRWIAENRDNRGYADCYTCTNCNCYTYTYTLMKDCEYDYCPNCGARMEV